MSILQLLTNNTILIDIQAKDQMSLLDEMIQTLDQEGYLTNQSAFKEAILKREEQVSTNIGDGVAIPHARTNSVRKPFILFARSSEGIWYGQEKCHLFFMIGVRENSSSEHIQILSSLATLLMDESFRAQLLLAQSKDGVLSSIEQKETAGYEYQEKDHASLANQKMKKVVAVTSCPTGIAHTYMAAESLKQAAQEMGVQLKVQTNGASGVGNQLSKEEISAADGVIVAADTHVDLTPFEGKNFVQTSVKDGIQQPKKLITAALAERTVPFQAKQSDKPKDTSEGNRPKFYQHVMNGVSYMIPFVVAGGILIAISFFFGINASNPDSPEYNVFAAFLGTVGGEAAFALMIPIFAGYISYSIANRPGLAPGAIGGMLAAIGGSGFLGGLVAGFLAGYIVLLLKKWLVHLPVSLQSLNPVLFYPVLGAFFTGFTMQFVVNVPLSNLNLFLVDWLGSLQGTNAVILGGLLAGMMAFDMGGPINKTASAFGLAMFSSGVYEPSAALMVGGMVPPLGIALATTFFKNKFTKEERDAGKATYIMGACFITEGVIPFAASDPLRVIPANVVGSIIGGSLCMYMDISLRAPHGGIFVIPIAANRPVLYIGCILLGSILTCIMIGLMKKSLVTQSVK
ncbi:fructose-specific PTS transporter subunit EIIC [Paenibacillus larvae]